MSDKNMDLISDSGLPVTTAKNPCKSGNFGTYLFDLVTPSNGVEDRVQFVISDIPSDIDLAVFPTLSVLAFGENEHAFFDLNENDLNYLLARLSPSSVAIEGRADDVMFYFDGYYDKLTDSQIAAYSILKPVLTSVESLSYAYIMESLFKLIQKSIATGDAYYLDYKTFSHLPKFVQILDFMRKKVKDGVAEWSADLETSLRNTVLI